jgi:hypothetical protein
MSISLRALGQISLRALGQKTRRSRGRIWKTRVSPGPPPAIRRVSRHSFRFRDLDGEFLLSPGSSYLLGLLLGASVLLVRVSSMISLSVPHGSDLSAYQ